MPQPRCAVRDCDHPTHTRICHSCQRELLDALAALGGRPDPHGGHCRGLIHDLQITITRTARTAAGLARTHRADDAQPMPYHPPAAALMRRARRIIASWADGFTGRGTAEAARWLAAHGDLRNEWAHYELVTLAAAIADMVDTHPDRVYYGRCTAASDGGRACGTDLFGADEDATVTCARCGTGYDTAAARKALRYKVSASLATARQISEAALSIYGRRLPVKTVRTWANRGEITTHGHHTESGAPLHRVSEVLDRARRHAESPGGTRGKARACA